MNGAHPNFLTLCHTINFNPIKRDIPIRKPHLSSESQEAESIIRYKVRPVHPVVVNIGSCYPHRFSHGGAYPSRNNHEYHTNLWAPCGPT